MHIGTDFCKAFDRVNLEIFFCKLQHFCFPATFFSLLRYFLSGRFIIVKYLNFCSPKFSVPSGVPQGDYHSWCTY